jgi:hypothetical protein
MGRHPSFAISTVAEISMKRHTLLPSMALLALLAQTVVRAEAEAPKTFEAQLAALEDGLAEAIHTRDWKMVELCVAGFKAAKLPAADLEQSILRAERNAGWKGILRAQAEPWGIAVRAAMGSTDSSTKLTKLALDAAPPAKTPDPKLFTTDPAAYSAALKEYQKTSFILDQKDEAALCLVLLKDPAIAAKLPELLDARCAARGQDTSRAYFGYRSDSLVTATLLSDHGNGWKTLLSAIESDKNALGTQVPLLASLNQMQAAAAKNPTTFSVEQEAAAAIPADFNTKTAKAFSSLLKRYAATQPRSYDNLMMAMLSLGNTLPPKSLTKDDAALIGDVRDQLNGAAAQYVRQQFDEILRKQNVEAAAVTPPKPPGDF